MAAINRNPSNSNQLQSSKFQLLFPRISSVTYFCQSVNIPSLSSQPVVQGTPFVDLPRPSDKLQYGSLDISFIVDEELWSWQIIHDWIRGYTFPCSFDEYKSLDRQSIMSLKSFAPQYSDAYLSILSAINTTKLKINFTNVFPTQLSEIDFDSRNNANEPVIARATFKFHIFDVTRP